MSWLANILCSAQISSMVLTKMKETVLFGQAQNGSRWDRACQLQRFPASGHKGCRNDRRAQRASNHQRANCCCHRLRLGQESGLFVDDCSSSFSYIFVCSGCRRAKRPDVRFGSRHVRRVQLDHWRRHFRSRIHGWRRSLGRRGFRQPNGRPLRCRVQAQTQERSLGFQDA